MSLITRTYNFTDGTTAYGSQVDAEIANIVNTLNSLDQGGTTWTNVKVTTLSPQADVNMNAHRLTSIGTPTTTGDAAQYPITVGQIAAGAVQGSTANSGGVPGIITQGTISTPDFRANAVSQIQSTSSGSSSSLLTGIGSKTITVTTGTVLIFAQASMNFLASGGGVYTFNVSLTRGATSLSGGQSTYSQAGLGASAAQLIGVSQIAVDTPGAGTFTYNFTYNTSAGSSYAVANFSLILIEIKA